MARKALVVLLAAAASLATVAAAGAPTGLLAPVEGEVWRDQHTGYPAVPDGEAAIRRVFGSPCSSRANANTFPMLAKDDGKLYPVHFHELLGGAASSNVDNDIVGHLHKARLDEQQKSGIWGYACRTKRTDSGEYSTHAWGIAVDVNSAYETQGRACNTVTDAYARVWQAHNWSWGKAWKDCMHFQYATGY